jgi:hypothetical protein
MSNRLAFSLSVVLLATADVPGVERLRAPANSIDTLPSEANISVLPPYAAIGNASGGQAAPTDTGKSASLSEESKLQLIRYVSGEFAKALKPMPGGKDGFLVYVGKPVDENLLTRTVANARRSGEYRRPGANHEARLSRARDRGGCQWRRQAQEKLA